MWWAFVSVWIYVCVDMCVCVCVSFHRSSPQNCLYGAPVWKKLGWTVIDHGSFLLNMNFILLMLLILNISWAYILTTPYKIICPLELTLSPQADGSRYPSSYMMVGGGWDYLLIKSGHPRIYQNEDMNPGGRNQMNQQVFKFQHTVFYIVLARKIMVKQNYNYLICTTLYKFAKESKNTISNRSPTSYPES